jgi:hypothetical protein
MKDHKLKNTQHFPDEPISAWDLPRLGIVVFLLGIGVGITLNLMVFGKIDIITMINLVVLDGGICAATIGPAWLIQKAYFVFSGGRTRTD